MRLKCTERDILKNCLEYLSYSRAGKFWRNNTGAFVAGEGTSKRFVRFGKSGSGDITGILKDGGRRIEIECKAPGGKQSENQKEFQRMIEENNGVYILARGIEDLRERNL